MIPGVEWLATGLIIISAILMVSIFVVKHRIIRIGFGAFLLYIGFKMAAAYLKALEIFILIFGLAALLSGIGLITLGLTKPSGKKTIPRTQQ